MTDKTMLLPCPFCGSASEWIGGSSKTLGGPLTSVRCSNGKCGAKYVPGGFQAEEWNRRALPTGDTVSVPRERLQALVDWMQLEQEELTCSALCDRTYESQGCPAGTCALESGKEEIRWWTKMLSAAQPGGRGETNYDDRVIKAREQNDGAAQATYPAQSGEIDGVTADPASAPSSVPAAMPTPHAYYGDHDELVSLLDYDELSAYATAEHERAEGKDAARTENWARLIKERDDAVAARVEAEKNMRIAEVREFEEHEKRVEAERALGEMRGLLRGASHALRSYQYGNAATDLSKDVANKLDAALAAKEKP